MTYHSEKLLPQAGLGLAVLAVIFLALPPPAAAQEKQFKYEITPFAAYRLGGSFHQKNGDAEFDIDESNAHGIMFSGKVQHNTQWEVLYARQNTDVDTEGLLGVNEPFDLDIEFFHLGGTYQFEGENVVPFMAFTLGVTHFDPGLDDYDSETVFAASLGGGWQFNATKRLGVRVEARAFATFVESDTQIFCESAGGAICLIEIDARTLTQWEARAGLVFRF